MKRYLFIPFEESGTYTRSDNHLTYITIRDSITKTTSTPSSVKIEIDDPCGTVLIDTGMVSLGDGKYSYDYQIDPTAQYGKYEITISTTTYTQVEKYHFYVFPWDVNNEVRHISGIGQNKVISDNALNEIIWESIKEAKERVDEPMCDVAPLPCIDSCSAYSYCINGSNTTFFIPPDIADHNDDGVINGYGEASCGTDVDGYYIDCDGFRHQVLITVQNAENGRLTVTKRDGNAIESTAKKVRFDYYKRSCTYDDDLFRIAVMYLAAHKCLLRFGELERASSADLHAAQNIKYVDPDRMWNQYQKEIRKIAVPTDGGVY